MPMNTAREARSRAAACTAATPQVPGAAGRLRSREPRAWSTHPWSNVLHPRAPRPRTTAES
eukprot:3091050-Prymnesium_polylepis.1